jgi:hypothetical protein
MRPNEEGVSAGPDGGAKLNTGTGDAKAVIAGSMNIGLRGQNVSAGNMRQKVYERRKIYRLAEPD